MGGMCAGMVSFTGAFECQSGIDFSCEIGIVEVTEYFGMMVKSGR